MRTASGVGTRRLCPSTACWMATAAPTASAAPEKVAMIPSPTLFATPVVGRHRLRQQPVVHAPEGLGRLLAEVRALGR
jgi:hypothetical protein